MNDAKFILENLIADELIAYRGGTNTYGVFSYTIMRKADRKGGILFLYPVERKQDQPNPFAGDLSFTITGVNYTTPGYAHIAYQPVQYQYFREAPPINLNQQLIQPIQQDPRNIQHYIDQIYELTNTHRNE